MKYTLLKNKVTGERRIRIATSASASAVRIGLAQHEINAFAEIVRESENPTRYAELRRKAIANRNRAERDQVMRDCGMVKTPYGWE